MSIRNDRPPPVHVWLASGPSGLGGPEGLFSRWPYRLRKFRSRAYREALTQLRAGTTYDLVHFDQFGVTQYWEPGAPSTYGCPNVESDVYRLAGKTGRTPVVRVWARQEGLKLRFAERRLLGVFDEIFVLAP